MASSFSKRLQREVLGNPKKALLLGLLCLVAGYFWAPLLAGSFKEADSTATAPIAADSTLPITPTTSAGPVQTPAVASSYTWKQIAECLDRTQSQQSTNIAADGRDPFKPAPSVEAPTESVVEVKTSAPSLSPQQAGLSLSSTMVGPRYGIALIGGEAYRVGDEIMAATDDSVTFRLKSIHAKHVVLERNGEEFELALKPAESLTEQVSAHTSTSAPVTSPEDE
jgi:hypothetical protein